LAQHATPFLGRADELSEIDRLTDAGARLLTLSGAAGTGKTRLAFAWSESRRDRFDEVIACMLSDAHDLDSVCSALSRALDVPLASGKSREDSVEQLGEAIAARGKILLVVDNVEQVADVAAPMLARFLSLASEARLLATSREVLRVEGEQVFEVPPLAEADAIALFVARVRLLRHDYALNDSSRAVVGKIVNELDRLPLAIELAAPRLRIMSEDELLARLPQRLDLLAGQRRDAAARQRTLRGAIEWSWRLLLPHEAEALAQTAVFRGGFTLEAAEAVIDLTAFPEAPATFEVLQSLREKSLLRMEAPAELPREPRFSHYESIRAYAWEKLEHREAALDRHARHYLDAGTSWAQGVASHGGVDRLRMLIVERENVASILSRAQDVNQRLRCVLALEPVLASRGPYDAWVEMLDAALSDESSDVGLRARALIVRARARMPRGRLAESASDLDEASRIGRETNDAYVQGRALANVAVLRSLQGSMGEAKDELLRALELHRIANDREYESIVLGNLANVCRDLGELELSRAHYEAAVKLTREIGFRRYEGFHLGNLGGLLHWQGHLEEARAYHEDALEILREVSDKRFYAFFSGNLGVILQELGHFDEARTRYQEALAVSREVGDRRTQSGVIGYVGGLEQEIGALDAGRSRYREALAILSAMGDRRHHAMIEAALGGVEARLGRVDDGKRLLDAAEEELRAIKDDLRLATVELHRGQHDLALAARANDEATIALHRRAARERMRNVDPKALARSDDVRFARRVLERALADTAQGIADPVLVVGPDAQWLRLPSGETIDLERRKSARLLILALAKKRVEAPDVAMSSDELLRHGWPGESVREDAGLNRLRVALSLLRQLGLRDVIVKREEGYLLAPAIEVTL